MTYNNKTLILIADDLPGVISRYEDRLHSDTTTTVSATSLEQLELVFDVYFEEIDAIILDGCIPGNDLNTVEFIERARQQGFYRPIIAASSAAYFRQLMVEAGCSHEASKDKAPELALQLLTDV